MSKYTRLVVTASKVLKIANIERSYYWDADCFTSDVKTMNQLMQVPCNPVTSVPTEDRLTKFINILKEEVQEGYEVIEAIEVFNSTEFKSDEARIAAHANILALLSDWLVDIQVYAESEMFRHGLSPDFSKDVVMASNFTKLGEDGKPVWRHDGKFMKGPNFIPPEPALQELYVNEINKALKGQQ